MKKLTLTIVSLVLFPSMVLAVPILQVGAPGGPGEGTYADYQATSTDPTETDTAFTSGSTLLVAGQYKNADVKLVGGQYTSPTGATGPDWSDTSLLGSGATAFDGSGAVLVASIADGLLASGTFSLTVDGATAFYSSESMSFFPNNHAPVQDSISDFLFFDIGDFANIANQIPNFDDSEPGTLKDGEIKSLALAISGLEWVHFDVMALVTEEINRQNVTTIESTLFNNPGSHDVTWKYDDDGGEDEIPEPSTLVLVGLGLVGLAAYRRKKN